MSKNLEEKFRSFCNSKNLEINQNQISTIKLLQDFYNKNFHFSIFHSQLLPTFSTKMGKNE